MLQQREDMKSRQAADLIEETFRSIEQMSNGEREDVMRLLRGWILIEKFGAERQATLFALHKYCISECLFNDAFWIAPSHYKMIIGSA